MVMSDEQIKKDIVDQLYWDQRVDASDVAVEVSDGEVKLRGSVPSFTARTAAYTDTLTIPGVKSVDNELEIELSPTLPTVTDDEIRMRVEQLLDWSGEVDATKIGVSVTEGYVTLDGNVAAYWEKIRAEELVGSVAGVSGVENALSVVPIESRTDELIAEDIMSALKRRTDLDINLVDVTVVKGVVTLSGTIPNWSTLQDVEIIARYTAGVLDVINELGTASL